MTYTDVIVYLSNRILQNFNTVYHSAEIVTTDGNIKFPAINHLNEWTNLSPTDQKETIYIRRNGDDEVAGDLGLGSCVKSYKMRSQLRIVYFQDHAKKHSEILSKLMQSVLVVNTKLNRIIQDKWKLQKEESSGEYTFSPTTAYFAIDIYAMWELMENTCEEDFCIDLDNPMKSCVVEESGSES